MLFYFIRHGQSEANILREFSNGVNKHPLTLLGEEQAQTAAVSLQGAGVRKIFTSPVLRAVQTANIIAHSLGVEVEITPALQEYDVGTFEGSRREEDWREFFEIMDAWLKGQDWQRRPGGGENMLDMQKRFMPFIEGLLQSWRDQDGALVLVGHGGLYRCMLPLVLGNVPFARMLELPIHNTTQIVAEARAAGLVCVRWDEIVFSD